MRQFRLPGFTVLAVLLLGIVFATAASANIEALPLGTEGSPVEFTAKGGAATFQENGGFAALKCTSSSGSGSFTSARLGPFTTTFAGCLTNVLGTLFLCTGLSDPANSSKVTVSGTFHLRYLLANIGLKHVGTLFLLNEVHFTCVAGATSILAKVKGCVIGLASPVNTDIAAKTGTSTVTLTQTGGKQNEKTAFNDAGTALETCELLAAENEGTFKESGENTTITNEKAKQGGLEILTELMA